MTPSRSHSGGPGWVVGRDPVVRQADSHEPAEDVGQKSQSRPRASIVMAVLQSGKPGRSASTNGSLQADLALRFRARARRRRPRRRGVGVPRREQVAVGTLDDPRRVALRLHGREDLFRLVNRPVGLGG